MCCLPDIPIIYIFVKSLQCERVCMQRSEIIIILTILHHCRRTLPAAGAPWVFGYKSIADHQRRLDIVADIRGW